MAAMTAAIIDGREMRSFELRKNLIPKRKGMLFCHLAATGSVAQGILLTKA